MANELQAAIEKLDARIQKARAERAVLLKLARANGALLKRKQAPRKKRAAALKAEPPRKRDGTRIAAVLDAVHDAGKKGITTRDIYDLVSDQISSPQGSIRTMLHLAKKKGLVSQLNGSWIATD